MPQRCGLFIRSLHITSEAGKPSPTKLMLVVLALWNDVAKMVPEMTRRMRSLRENVPT